MAGLFFPSFLTPVAGRAAAFTLVILSFWATGFIAEYLTALIFFTGAMLFNIAPPSIIFSGFSSGAFWAGCSEKNYWYPFCGPITFSTIAARKQSLAKAGPNPTVSEKSHAGSGFYHRF